MNINIDQNPPTKEVIQSEKQTLIDECITLRKKIAKTLNFLSIFLVLPALYFATHFDGTHPNDFLMITGLAFILGIYISCLFYNKGSVDPVIKIDGSFQTRFSIVYEEYSFFIIPIAASCIINCFLASDFLTPSIVTVAITSFVSTFFSNILYDLFLRGKQNSISNYNPCTHGEMNKIVEFLPINEIKEYCHKVGLQDRDIISIEYAAIENTHSIKQLDIQNKQTRKIIFNN